MMIENGSPVKVVGVKSSRLVVRAYDSSKDESVRPAEPPSAPPHEDRSPAADTVIASSSHTGEDSGILDFEIPDS